jgi:CRISPR/Cas system CMR-associated protein Cmr1 (group 7 of RAMP superfamily)
LRKEEAAIWGDTERSSLVKLEMFGFKPGAERLAATRT